MSQWKSVRERLAEQKDRPVKPPEQFKRKGEELRKRLKEKKRDEA